MERDKLGTVYAVACVAMPAVPFCFLLWKISQFGFFFPYWDAWNFVPFIGKSLTSHVTLGDFWVMHNEHRPMVPRMIMLALESVSAWNVFWDIVVNVVFGLGILGVVSVLAVGVGKEEKNGARNWGAVPLLGILALSWGQMENWIWGWQMMVFMSVFFVCAGVLLLSQGGGDNKSLALGIAMGFLATFSFANGMLYWIAAVPVVILVKDVRVKDRLPQLGVWVLAAAVAISLYFYQYEKPGVSPSLLDALKMPLQFAGYIILYVSGPITTLWFAPTWHVTDAPVGVFHFIPGVLGMCAMAVLLYLLLRARKAPLYVLAPWLSLAAYAAGSDLLTAIGRVGFGLEHGITSRYMTIANLFWFALIGLALCYMRYHRSSCEQGGHSGHEKTKECSSYSKGICLPLMFTLLGLTVFSCFGTHHANAELEQLATWKRLSWEGIRMGYEHPMFLHDVSGDAEAMEKEYLPFLKSQKLCGLSEMPEKDISKLGDYMRVARDFKEMGLLPQAKVYTGVALYLDAGDMEAQVMMKELGN